MIEDSVLQAEWIVACASRELHEQPLQVTILGEHVVLFRTAAGVHAFRDVCVHRGATLSLGCVRDDQLVCPYHGWAYDGDGRCVHIPQLPSDQPIPTMARVQRYACIESFGFVWVNLRGAEGESSVRGAEGERPQLPGGDDAAFRHVVWGPCKVRAKPPRIIENFLDVGHLPFVHEGYLGVPTHAQIGDYRVTHGEDGVLRSGEIEMYQPDPDGTGQPRNVYYTYEILGPLQVRFIKRDPLTAQRMAIVLCVRPDDEQSSTAYGLISFDYDTGMTDEQITDFQDMIFGQDKPIVEHQRPEGLPLDLQAELSLKCDRVSIAYRKYLVERGVTFGTA
ncbi:aromatic ring-hydroxylating dioxygenase subunit alpha [Alicyclobacillus cycloheptanicus]|uniref:Phenylpropionate dioxygenase-like ring-hydroxylating dioxygenase large terminal subunit n=1 Tax=Alicyclobacillus cycloheptanicus TaxID=1457 RepID=A0ABT9XFW8_9BACL|nr:aromatic ring-hydroxylating dioxygenase subunit alpha [Alicyclobacillus cycloheptanicus]MDQ0189190.1 phenylpropionate dioxygenase-like ring-hydroxylating dioxygenase large terminal subunit [Alicyclobacillus cycloheptanicus]WDM00376.1 aromatic ring-hydroxylating dioxygenase subunit alpha [Alicyclobacillus cycloheptanicus]